ncbi:MAG: hypothetical protein F6K49_39160, partial [Moorea sp. SIO3I6]|nr:hypothetical protein [Moorena sp. SIO3I6]
MTGKCPLPRCAFRRRIKFATGRTAPDSRLPTPDSRLPTPDSRLPTPDSRLPNRNMEPLLQIRPHYRVEIIQPNHV